MAALVLEVFKNDQPDKVLFYIGVIGDTWFHVPDGCATEIYGWHRVRLSERTWQSYAQRNVDRTRVNVWTGKPAPLNADGTLK